MADRRSITRAPRLGLLALVVAPAALLAAAPAAAAPGAAFFSGDVVVYRVGDGSAPLSSAATPVFLDEFSPGGGLQSSTALPTASAAANHRCTASGTATSEGQLTRSTDGRYLLAPCYDAAPGTASIAATTAASTPRVIGRVDNAKTIDTTTALTDAYSGNNIRSATSLDGIRLYAGGAGSTTDGGVRTALLGNTASTQLESVVTNVRTVTIAGGQLYLATGSSTQKGVNTVGSPPPPSAPGQPTNQLPGAPEGGASDSAYAFRLVQLNPASTGPDTLYVADDTAGQVRKFTLASGSWTQTGAVAAPGVRGLTAETAGTATTIFATSGTTLFSVSDTTGYGGTVSGTAVSLATAPTNEAFRGVALAPQPLVNPGTAIPEVPLAAALPLLGLGAFGAVATARRRRLVRAAA